MSIKSQVCCMLGIMFFCVALVHAIPLGGSKGEWFPKDMTIKGKTTIGATEISTSTLFVAGVVESTAGFKCPDGTVLMSTVTLGGSSQWATSGNDIYYTVGKVSVGTGTASEFKFTLGGDGGIMAKGTFGSGAALTTSGEGTRLMWYPKKAAFRVGYAYAGAWDEASIGDYSAATGYYTRASGTASVALGYGAIASGVYSTAMGYGTQATGVASTAMGQWTIPSGGLSTAMGYNTKASGDLSTAMGSSTTSQPFASVVLGQYNVVSGSTNSWINTDPLFVIGNGASDVSRSNAMTVLKNGNVGIGTVNPGAKLEVNGNAKISGGLQPDYDSGWFAENTSSDHQTIKNHNLGVIPSHIEIWFSPDNPPSQWVYPVAAFSLNQRWECPDIRVSATQIELSCYSGGKLYDWYNAGTLAWSSWTTGYIRICIWK